MMRGDMKTVAITGGKGGIGKTSIAVNLGIALASQGKRVVIFDADLQLANLDIVLGVQAPYSLQHVVSQEKTLREILHPCPGGIRAITGGSAIPSLMAAGPKRMALFFDQIRDLGKDTDILLFDLAAGLDNRTLSFLSFAQHALVVVTPDPASVTDAYATLKMAGKRAAATELSLVVNMASGPHEAGRIHRTVNSIAKCYLGKQIRALGLIHSDQEVSLSIRRRDPFMLSAARCQAARDMELLAIALTQTIMRPMLQSA